MNNTLKIGLKHTVTELVGSHNVASRYGSGLLDVYATPAMIALMENAAMNVVQQLLPDGYQTVGIEVNVQHTRATPVGETVTCTATLIEVDGKRLVFEVVADDGRGEIGRGSHTRYIVETKRFMEKIQR